ncbi:hypothetical protein ACVIGB_000068 [Bradyrhizobium sp. USDA 4341]
MDQIGIPELAIMRRDEESGDKRPGSYSAIAADPAIKLRRADAIAFTVTHEFHVLEEPVGLGVRDARMFPPDQDKVMAKAGRRMFRGELPQPALRAAASDVLRRRIQDRPTDAQDIKSKVEGDWRAYGKAYEEKANLRTPEVRQRALRRIARLERYIHALIDEMESDALFVALQDLPQAARLIERGDWQNTSYVKLPNLAEISNELMKHTVFPSGFDRFKAEMKSLWCALAISAYYAERIALARVRDAADRELSKVARTWQRHFRNLYAAEDDAIAPEEAANPFIQTNQPELLYRGLASTWPDNAIWPASTWPSVPKNYVSLARQAESRADRGELSAIRREATVRAAVGRILRLGDEYRSAPRERGGAYQETTVDRILQGQDFMPTVGKDVPEVAASRFAELVFRYCRNLERDRLAALEFGGRGVKVISSQPQPATAAQLPDLPI